VITVGVSHFEVLCRFTLTMQKRTLYAQQADPETNEGERRRRDRYIFWSKPRAVCKYSGAL